MIYTNARATEFAPNSGVFGDSRFNGANEIFPGLAFVAMVTKFGLFSHKIGHNSACTISKAAEHQVFGHVQFYVVYKHLFCTLMIYNVIRTTIGLSW